MKSGPDNGPRGRRRLSPDELALWVQVTRTIRARAGVTPPEVPAEDAPGKDLQAAPSASGAARSDPAPKPSKGPYRPPALPLAPIERRLRQRLSRGQIDVDMKIDLHGMRQDEAHHALRRFLVRARQQEARLVLVVTGKGASKALYNLERASESGVLRRNVPHWLTAPDLRHLVLGFEEAALAHGGSGALYVRLRGKSPAGVSRD